MKRLTKYTIQLISSLLLALLTAGCVADRNVSDCITEGEEVELEFAFQVPALETSLRGLSEAQEKQVDKMKILVFNTQDDSGQTLPESAETFAYEAKYKNISQANGTTLIRCQLKASNKPMRIVCIANHEFDTSILVEGKTKEAILEDALMVKSFTKSGWKTDGSQLIPMWGESDAQPVSRKTKFNDCTANANGVIHLVRALARVDVGINFDQDQNAQGGAKFQIKSVRVYRYAQSMFVTGTQSTTYYQTTNGREPLPHTPKNMTAATDADHLKFEANAGVNSYVRNIYIPEISNRLDNGKDKNKDQRICLVIGGYYDGSKTETYYRVDFMRTEQDASKHETTKYLDVLRNHRYRFNITKIEGPGTDTPGEALTTEPVNIAYDVIVWDEGKIDKIVYDGQYYLSVSKDKFHFGKDASSENITIRTNWPKGYKIVDEKGTVWAKSEQEATGTNKWAYFTATSSQELVDEDMTTTLNVLDNKTGADREITYKQLFVQAGRIKWPLKVTQSNKIELDIKLYEQDKTTAKLSDEPISSLQLTEGVETAKLVAVRYTPGADLERIPLATPEKYRWIRIDGRNEPGKALYRVEMASGTALPDDFNITEMSRFRVTKQGAEAQANLAINFMRYDAIPYSDSKLTINMTRENGKYVLINVPGNFYIKANAPYELTVESINIGQGAVETNTAKVVHDWTEGTLVNKSESGRMSGDKITFQPFDWINGETYDNKKTTPGNLLSASVTFSLAPTDTERPFKPKTFTINLAAGIIQPEANCYIMKAQQKLPILIPLSRINTAADWYAQYEDECNKVVEERRKIGGSNELGLSNAEYKRFEDNGGFKLPHFTEGDPNIEASVIWSTICGPNRTNPTTETGFSPAPKVIVVDGKSYLMISLAGKYERDQGNAVVGVHYKGDNKKFLWSWHIWVVKEYPWTPDGRESARPFMNRNLGALEFGGGLQDGKASLLYSGLVYQFGRKDPFYLDAYVKSAKNNSGWIRPEGFIMGDPAYKMKEMDVCYGWGTNTRYYTMRDLIRYPYQIAMRDRNSAYILECGGPNRFFLNGTVLWQGEALYTRHDQRARTLLEARTKKTPFDPSPYGWKVPSAGVLEIRKLLNIPSKYLTNNGIIQAGLGPERVINYFTYQPDNVVYLHTATPDIGSKGNNDIFNNGVIGLKWNSSNSSWEETFNVDATHPNARSTGLPVRSIENERETDYKRYTEEGFYHSVSTSR